MVQHNTIDHTGLTGVSTVSYASNVNSVAGANTGGAATTVTRGDHVHLGVRSITHSSNTFSGPITFTTEGDLAITSPSTGTLAFKALTGGGAASSSVKSYVSNPGLRPPDSAVSWPRSRSGTLGAVCSARPHPC